MLHQAWVTARDFEQRDFADFAEFEGLELIS